MWKKFLDDNCLRRAQFYRIPVPKREEHPARNGKKRNAEVSEEIFSKRQNKIHFDLSFDYCMCVKTCIEFCVIQMLEEIMYFERKNYLFHALKWTWICFWYNFSCVLSMSNITFSNAIWKNKHRSWVFRRIQIALVLRGYSFSKLHCGNILSLIHIFLFAHLQLLL
jgi:hypothetical protein